MSFQFAGYFAKPRCPITSILPSGAVWRFIETPFQGIGIQLPSLFGKSPPPEEIRTLAGELGIEEVEDWLYITYVTWGGEIDFVYGLGKCGSVPFGPIKEESLDRVESVYFALMEAFGIGYEDAARFVPFQRGFWDQS